MPDSIMFLLRDQWANVVNKFVTVTTFGPQQYADHTLDPSAGRHLFLGAV